MVDIKEGIAVEEAEAEEVVAAEMVVVEMEIGVVLTLGR